MIVSGNFFIPLMHLFSLFLFILWLLFNSIELAKEISEQNKESYQKNLQHFIVLQSLKRKLDLFSVETTELDNVMTDLRHSLKHPFNSYFGSGFRTHTSIYLLNYYYSVWLLFLLSSFVLCTRVAIFFYYMENCTQLIFFNFFNTHGFRSNDFCLLVTKILWCLYIINREFRSLPAWLHFSCQKTILATWNWCY